MTDQLILKAAARRIAKARTQLLLSPKFVFWATCALHLKPIPYEGMMVCERGPIGTDGTRLYYDPDFIVGGLDSAYEQKFGVKASKPIPPWTDAELLGVIAHEVSHCTKGDVWRRGSREPGKWNIAADRRINQELLKNNLELPKDGQLGTLADFGRSAEEIYRELPDDPNDGGKGQGPGSPGAGGSMGGDIREPGQPEPGQDPSQGNSMSAAERQAAAQDLQRKWDLVARQAAQIAKAQGHLPAGAEHLIEPIRPQLDPYAMLRHFVSMCRRDDYSWSRGSRRAAYRGLYLPSLYSEGIGELLIGMDTSGSCSSVAPLFLGFLNSVLTEVKPERVWFVECDAAVHNVTEFGEGEALPEQVPVHGFGGTSMRPIWEWADEHNINPVCAIVLTDLEMTDHDLGDARPHPTLWVSSTDRIAPWGETVRMEA
jgi:predicted metal-dependent peptidase